MKFSLKTGYVVQCPKCIPSHAMQVILHKATNQNCKSEKSGNSKTDAGTDIQIIYIHKLVDTYPNRLTVLHSHHSACSPWELNP